MNVSFTRFFAQHFLHPIKSTSRPQKAFIVAVTSVACYALRQYAVAALALSLGITHTLCGLYNFYNRPTGGAGDGKVANVAQKNLGKDKKKATNSNTGSVKTKKSGSTSSSVVKPTTPSSGPTISSTTKPTVDSTIVEETKSEPKKELVSKPPVKIEMTPSVHKVVEKSMAPRKPLEFGPNAFNRPGETEVKEVYLSEGDIESIVSNKHYKCFEADNPLYVKKGHTECMKVSDLIKMTAENGLPAYEFKKESTIKKLRYILKFIELKSDASPTFEQKRIAQRVADGFKACQAIQDSMIEDTYNELVSGGSVVQTIFCLWDVFKKQKLDELICGRHPNCQKAPDSTPKEQYAHIRSGYMVLLSDKYGLGEKETALVDKCRNTDVWPQWESKELLYSLYESKLDLKEFARTIIIEDVNNPTKDTSRINKIEFSKWVTKAIKDLQVVGTETVAFGFYSEFKDYTGIKGKPSEDQEDQTQPYISMEETEVLLKTLGICKE